MTIFGSGGCSLHALATCLWSLSQFLSEYEFDNMPFGFHYSLNRNGEIASSYSQSGWQIAWCRLLFFCSLGIFYNIHNSVNLASCLAQWFSDDVFHNVSVSPSLHGARPNNLIGQADIHWAWWIPPGQLMLVSRPEGNKMNLNSFVSLKTLKKHPPLYKSEAKSQKFVLPSCNQSPIVWRVEHIPSCECHHWSLFYAAG